MKIPCKKCICIPVCRHKTYRKFVLDCILVEKYLYGKRGAYLAGVVHSKYREFTNRQYQTTLIVKPKHWGVYYGNH